MLKRIVVLTALIIAGGPVLAQQTSPVADEAQANCNIGQGTLAVQLGQTQMQVIALRKQLAEATKKLDEVVKAPPKEGTPQ